MKNSYELRRARRRDVAFVAANMRQSDVDEVWAAKHASPQHALMSSFLSSRDISFTGLANGEPVLMFGVVPPSPLGAVATPWALGTNALREHFREFVRRSKPVVETISLMFPVLENYVDARNIDAIRWLQWVGFSVYYPNTYGVEQLPFHRFDKRQ